MAVETDVIEKAREGDPEAFNQIVRAYQRRVLGTIYHILAEPGEVEDVAQDVFVRVYRSLHQLRSSDVFEPWLYRLTVNTAYDYLRKRRRRCDTPMSCFHDEQVHTMDAAAGSRSFERQERIKEVREFVGSLLDDIPKRDRILLVLKEVQGLSLKELEGIYGVNENALKVRLFRARKRAIRAFEKLQEQEERTHRDRSPAQPHVRPALATG